MIGLVPALAVALLQTAPAPEVLPRPGDTVSAYTVQAGDTLQGITQRFLGDSSLWQENHRLNPWLRDPHILTVGQELRIIVKRIPPQRSARVVVVARRVEEKPTTDDWRPTAPGNVLHEKEGLRTGRASSSALAFDDGSQLDLSEDSLVFLKEMASVGGTKKQSLEIVTGQADLNSRLPKNARRSDIEVLVGTTVLRPSAESGSARARHGREGGAQVMVFNGRGDVSAAGVTVAVPEGMGTAVPQTGPPAPPERLLKAPTLETPQSGLAVAYSNPRFSWSALTAAATYTFELCADAQCQKLVERAVGLKTPEFRSHGLSEGAYFWRVMGVSASVLDGFPSETRPLQIAPIANTAMVDDVEPPVTAISIEGPWIARTDGSALVAPTAHVALEARDDRAGVDLLQYRFDGAAWQTYSKPFGIDAKGTHTLEVIARDLAGQESAVIAIKIERSEAVPDAPIVRGEAGKSVLVPVGK